MCNINNVEDSNDTLQALSNKQSNNPEGISKRFPKHISLYMYECN